MADGQNRDRQTIAHSSVGPVRESPLRGGARRRKPKKCFQDPAAQVDVIGGMLHKVERMLALVKETGADIQIINGLVPGRVKEALLGKKVVGTFVRK